MGEWEELKRKIIKIEGQHIWKPEKTGDFTTKSDWRELRNSIENLTY